MASEDLTWVHSAHIKAVKNTLASALDKNLEYPLYLPWSTSLNFIAVQRSTDRYCLTVAPQQALDLRFNTLRAPIIPAAPASEAASRAPSLHLSGNLSALTTLPATAPPDVQQLAESISQVQLRPRRKQNDPTGKQSASALQPASGYTNDLEYALSPSAATTSDANPDGSNSYRIPDFCVYIERNGIQSLPIIVEVKRIGAFYNYNSEEQLDLVFDMSQRQVLYQLKAAFDTYPAQNDVHMLFVVGSHWRMIHATRAAMESLQFPDPDALVADYSAILSVAFGDEAAGGRSSRLFGMTACYTLLNDDQTDYHTQFKGNITKALGRFGTKVPKPPRN